MEKKTFYANGKLLITGEYLVLQGALALAVPTVMGQWMTVREGIQDFENTGVRDGVIEWKSYYKEDCWFEAEFSLPGLEIIETTSNKTAIYLQNLLREAVEQNPTIINENYALKVESHLGFSQEWGLGSSSSLISNIAEWFGIDAYSLFKKTQQGSGYDIACAKAKGPIRYRLVLGSPVMEKVTFDPAFKDKLAFVYSGRKQDSSASVREYLIPKAVPADAKERISQISRDITVVKTLKEFNTLLDEHEEIMSVILGLQKVKDNRFSDYPGSIKSLGAWGGDFLLVTHEGGLNQIKSYFSNKDLNVIFAFDELIRGGGH